MSKNSDRIFKGGAHYITSPFGHRISPITGQPEGHDGVDYGTHDLKLPQYAFADGIVIQAGTDGNGGKYVFIRYDGLGYVGVHYHLDTIAVAPGQRVQAGTLVGTTGDTGLATGVHLHFGWCPITGYSWKWENCEWEDFEKYIFPERENEMDRLHGLDVSEYQMGLDFTALKGVDFAILRTGFGDEVEGRKDECFDTFASDCKTKEIPLGAYHFSYSATAEEAKGEAAFCLKILDPFRDCITLPVFYDFEYGSAAWITQFGVTAGPELVQALTVSFCEAVKAAGYIPGVYTNLDLYNQFYGDAFFYAHPDYKFWYARPGLEKPDKDCDIWQCASEPGPEYGFPDTVDKNVCYMDIPAPLEGRWLYVEGPNAKSAQFFSGRSVEDVQGYLAPDTCYELTYIEAVDSAVGAFSGPWCRFKNAVGEEYWCWALRDRTQIKALSVDPEPVEPEPEPAPAPVVASGWLIKFLRWLLRLFGGAEE